MANQRIIDKIIKLKALQNENENEHEATAAGFLLEKLIREYEIDPSLFEAEEKHDYTLKRHVGMWEVVRHVCSYLDIDLFTTRRGFYTFIIKCTVTEKALFEAYYEELLIKYRDQKEVYKEKLKSYVAGFLTRAYPLKDPVCPKCRSKNYLFNKDTTRYECEDCPHISKKVKINFVDGGAYRSGERDSNRFLSNKKKEELSW